MSQPPSGQRRRTSRHASAEVSPLKPRTTHNTPFKKDRLGSMDDAKFDIGKPQGLYDTDNIREKVLKWQQVAADTASDTESLRPLRIRPAEANAQADDPEKHFQITDIDVPETGAEKSDNKLNDNNISRSSIAQRRLEKDVRQASAPRKRVVSDEHWKKSRETRAVTEEPRKEVPRTVKKLDGWIRKKPPTRASEGRYEPHTEKPTHSPKNARDYANPGKNAPSPNYRDAESDTETQSDLETPISGTPQSSGLGSGTKLSKSPSKEAKPAMIIRKRRKSEARRPSNNYRAEVNTTESGLQNNASHARRRTKDRPHSPRGSTEGEPDHDTTADVPTPPQSYGSRIEAWLTEAVDPFVESSKLKDRRRSRSGLEPLNDMPSTRPRKVSQNYDEDMPLPLNIKPKRQRTAHNRINGHGEVSNSPDIEKSLESPPLLKRAGAKRATHSPERGLHINKDEDHSSVGSSSIDGSIMDFSKIDISNNPPNSFDRYDRRAFPTTGKRLSTIASVETFRSKEVPSNRPKASRGNFSPVRTKGDEKTHIRGFDEASESMLQGDAKMAPHVDLISSLSMPESISKSIRSARSVKTSKSLPINMSTDEIMKELVLEETKYVRELRTLVDGVIPVLLSCVLSKSNTLVASGLFGAGKDATTPIVNMGIALERLNSIHKRVPVTSADALLLWAQGAHRVYMDYIKAWKMGFQDVVVNLAPAENSSSLLPMTIPRKPVPGQNSTLPQNKEGDVVDADGERVDVAFLLKRPLIRIKYLAKTLKGIHQADPTEKAELWSSRYQDLVVQAKNKQNEERARLEDEAAANIDTTRAREPQTLAPLVDVVIDPSKCVRARDYFNLKLFHSTGQQVDCHIELILRDNADEATGRGDVLICEVDSTSRWLLFPPVLQDNVSARRGESKGEIVLMIRGNCSNGQEWRELLSLTSNDDKAEQEWIQMFGLYPTPPPAPSVSGFSIAEEGNMVLANLQGFGLPSPSEFDVPMGEQPTEISKRLNLVSSAAAPSGDVSLPLPYPVKFEISRRPVSMPVEPSTRTSPATGLSPSPNDKTDRLRYTSVSLQNSPITRPAFHRQKASVPSKELPNVPRVRNDAPKSSTPLTPSQERYSSDLASKSQRRSPQGRSEDSPPRPPRTPHQLGGSQSPRFSPPHSGSNRGRRSSSPLKHEYEPSSESDSNAGGRGSRSDDEESITSDSSAGDLVPSMLPAAAYQKGSNTKRPESLYTAPGSATISPSQSASQSPYRTVPVQPGLAPKTIASIFSWSEKGVWERLHPDECSVVVSPGLIEAFEMSASHSSNTVHTKDGSLDQRPPGAQPLVALELTPLVPLRRGTAIDISIRSPPMGVSLIKSGNNIMFRSRNGQECETLYNMINQARINNPTYIALQNARGPNGESNWAQFMDRRSSMRRTSSGTSSWFRFGSRRGGGYRAGSRRRVRSVSGDTESSIATMSSAFSALRRFSNNGNRMFNVAKSTITSRTGGVIGGGNLTRSSTTFSSSGSYGSGDLVPGADDLALPPDLTMNGSTPLGLTNQKIRLYLREAAGKWLDMGSARLTIMHPPRSVSADPMTPARQMQQERRVVIIGKTQGERLLDVTLGETSFERVARTGIAVSVMERLVGPNGQLETVGKTGGVLGSRVKVYMIQLKTEAETAYTFSLVGRLRY